jgi:hypothetical protein
MSLPPQIMKWVKTYIWDNSGSSEVQVNNEKETAVLPTFPVASIVYNY